MLLLLTTARKTTIFPQLGASPHSGHALHWISKTHGCNIEKQTNRFRTSHGSKTKRLMKVQQNSLCVWWSPVGDRGWASQRRCITETGAGVVAMLTCKPGDIWHVEQPKCGNVKECHWQLRLLDFGNQTTNIKTSINLFKEKTLPQLDGQEQLGENWAFAAEMTASDYCLFSPPTKGSMKWI